MKVLIVDDEIDLCLLLKSYFTRKGYLVMLSHTLKEGLASIAAFDPDFLFLDNNLPDGTGWKEAPRIAENNPALQLYLISAYHPSLPVMPPGASVKIIEKPVSFSDLDRYFATIPRKEKESPGADV